MHQTVTSINTWAVHQEVEAKAHFRKNDKGGILARVIEYKLEDPQRTGHGEVHRLLTNLLDAEEHPAMDCGKNCMHYQLRAL
jgi:hypothetical protein